MINYLSVDDGRNREGKICYIITIILHLVYCIVFQSIAGMKIARIARE